MKTFLLFCMFCSNLLLYSQNLVPNPSFEDTVQINGGPSPKEWNTNLGTPDYFSPYYSQAVSGFWTPISGRGSEEAKQGVAYFGFAALDGTRIGRNFREYMQTELLDTLVKDGEYLIQFYISLADSFHLAVDEKDIGIFISDELESNNFDHEVREFRPFYTSDSSWNASNKNGWEKFAYNYVAKGGEKALTIGCFKTNAEITVDTVGNGGITFLAEKGAYYFIDNISVVRTDSSVSLRENELINQIELFPNPAAEQLNLVYSGKETLNFQWYNLKGQLLNVKVQKRGNRYRFQTATLPQGIYFLQLSNGKSQTTLKIVRR